jgi:hypothetical protein
VHERCPFTARSGATPGAASGRISVSAAGAMASNVARAWRARSSSARTSSVIWAGELIGEFRAAAAVEYGEVLERLPICSSLTPS